MSIGFGTRAGDRCEHLSVGEDTIWRLIRRSYLLSKQGSKPECGAKIIRNATATSDAVHYWHRHWLTVTLSPADSDTVTGWQSLTSCTACIWTSNMVTHDTCWWYCIVGFCGQSRYCNSFCYPVARFWPTLSLSCVVCGVSAKSFSDRSRPMPCTSSLCDRNRQQQQQTWILDMHSIPYIKCRLNDCLEWYKWVLTNLDHDRQCRTLITPSHESPVVYSLSQLQRTEEA